MSAQAPSLLATVECFLQQQLQAAPAVRGLVLGYSGGLDSTVLLHVLALLAPRLGLRLRALHVHHGLSKNADAWVAHVRQQCAVRAIPVQIENVQVPATASVEAAARLVRRQAMQRCLQADEALLLAQHRDDQAETVLFRLLRGAGVTGLAAMRAATVLPGPEAAHRPLWRPLLTQSRASLETYARAQALSWVDDESNQDQGYARNFLRHSILPALHRHWPQAGSVLAATAERMQEADLLLHEMAVELAVQAVDARQRLSIPALQALSTARQKLLLRYWLAQQALPLPAENVLAKIGTDMLAARADACPCLRWPGVELRRYRQHLYAMSPLLPLPAGWQCEWSGQTPLPLPDGRILACAADTAQAGPFRVSFRRGGERIQLSGQLHSRELKTVLQERDVPPWRRVRLPLIWQGDQLLAVAGVPGSALTRVAGLQFFLQTPSSALCGGDGAA